MHGADDGEDDEGGEEVVGLVVEQVLRDAVQPPLLVVQVRDLYVIGVEEIFHRYIDIHIELAFCLPETGLCR